MTISAKVLFRWFLLLCANAIAAFLLYGILYAAMHAMGEAGTPIILVQWFFFVSVIFFSPWQMWLSYKVEEYIEDSKLSHFALAGVLFALPGSLISLLLIPHVGLLLSVFVYGIGSNLIYGLLLKKFYRNSL
jgi:hypothetical protein